MGACCDKHRPQTVPSPKAADAQAPCSPEEMGGLPPAPAAAAPKQLPPRTTTTKAEAATGTGPGGEPRMVCPTNSGGNLLAHRSLSGFQSMGAKSAPQQVKVVEDATLENPSHVRISRTVNRSTTRHGTKTINQYEVLDSLGQGGYGKVKLALNLDDGGLYALKVVNKQRLEKLIWYGRPALDNIRREIAILQRLRHDNIVTLHEVIDDPAYHKLYIVMDYCSKGAVVKVDAETGVVETERDLAPSEAQSNNSGLLYTEQRDSRQSLGDWKAPAIDVDTVPASTGTANAHASAGCLTVQGLLSVNDGFVDRQDTGSESFHVSTSWQGSPGGQCHVADVALGICKALRYCHSKGVVHRDVKPGNVFLDASGTPKLGDFGAAIVFSASGEVISEDGPGGGDAASNSPPGTARGGDRDSPKELTISVPQTLPMLPEETSRSAGSGGGGGVANRSGAHTCSRHQNIVHPVTEDASGGWSPDDALSLWPSNAGGGGGGSQLGDSPRPPDNRLKLHLPGSSKPTTPRTPTSPYYSGRPRASLTDATAANAGAAAGGQSGGGKRAPSERSPESDFDRSPSEVPISRQASAPPDASAIDSIEQTMTPAERAFFTRGLFTQVEGTPAFWSPEMCRIVDGYMLSPELFAYSMVDCWQVGLLLYFFLKGFYPFTAESQKRLISRIYRKEVDTTELPPALGQPIQGLLGKDYTTRWSMDDLRDNASFWAALKKWPRNRLASSPPPPQPQPRD